MSRREEYTLGRETLRAVQRGDHREGVWGDVVDGEVAPGGRMLRDRSTETEVGGNPVGRRAGTPEARETEDRGHAGQGHSAVQGSGGAGRGAAQLSHRADGRAAGQHR